MLKLPLPEQRKQNRTIKTNLLNEINLIHFPPPPPSNILIALHSCYTQVYTLSHPFFIILGNSVRRISNCKARILLCRLFLLENTKPLTLSAVQQAASWRKVVKKVSNEKEEKLYYILCFFSFCLQNSICALRVAVSFSNSRSSQLTRKAVKNFPGVLYKISLQANNQQPYQWDKSCCTTHDNVAFSRVTKDS